MAELDRHESGAAGAAAPAPGVTLIGHYPPPHGGVGSLMVQMKNALTDAGCRVTIFNLGRGRPEGEDVVNFERGNRVRQVIDLTRAFSRSRSDIFHYVSASYRSFWMGTACLVAANAAGRKLVVSFVGGAFRAFAESMSPAGILWARLSLSKAAALVACNADIQRSLVRLVPGRAVPRITNCFPMAIDGSGALPDEIGRFLEDRGPIVSVTGAASASYALGDAVDALDRARSWYPDIGMVLVLTAFGTEAEERALSEKIDRRGLGGHVLVARDLPDFAALLSRSDVFLRSTLIDGDSMSVREALYLGIPTVASDTPFRPDGVILFRKGDAADMAEKLRSALEAGRGSPDAARRESEENLSALFGIYASALGPGNAFERAGLAAPASATLERRTAE